MPTRRRTLAAAGTASSALLAGCTGFLFGEGVTFEATAASVSESVLAETGYEHNEDRPIEFEETVEAGGESRDVTVINWQAEYDRSIDLSAVGQGEQRAATFSAITSPDVEVLGQSVNPLSGMEPSRIVDQAQQRYEQFGSAEKVDETEATLLGTAAVVEEFEAEARLTDIGVTVDLTLFVTEAVESGEDLALAIAAYPTFLDSQERDNAFALIEGVQHDG